ncbi:MAG: DUF3365 domain-containing protein [Rhodocyclaceae bacterium]|nr:DUF3365 domain-containing protein [Rhodocyclaceae bacterium]
MKLVVKFNLVFLVVFLLGFGASGLISWQVLQQNARDEVLQNARIMMEAASAVRAYTNTQIKPLLATQMKYEFLPQSVPAYGAQETFETLRKDHPEYGYKEATLNPTNPRDKASDWEEEIVRSFRNDPTLPELSNLRQTPLGESLFLARPIQIKSPGCLQCHSTAEAAPQTMIARYGGANGFGWQLDEIIGAQVVSVPTTVTFNRAKETFTVFMGSLAGVFAFIFIALNLLLNALVIRPVNRLAKVADEVSLGNLEAGELEATGRDEISQLTQAFGRMRKSLVQAFQMIED